MDRWKADRGRAAWLDAMGLAAILIVAAWPAADALGQGACCAHCGAVSGLRSVCRPVMTTRPVEVTRWDVAEDEIAVPRGRLFGVGKGHHASPCGGGLLCSLGLCTNGCKVRPRNRLMRKTLLEEQPVIVWTVDTLCEPCMQQWSAADSPRHAVEPAASQTSAETVLRAIHGSLPRQ